MALGTGEAKYERKLRDLARRFPARMAVKIAYDNTLAHKIEAGADLFLMPSRYEPCGLNQIYSLRYGTVPLFAPPEAWTTPSRLTTRKAARARASSFRSTAAKPC